MKRVKTVIFTGEVELDYWYAQLQKAAYLSGDEQFTGLYRSTDSIVCSVLVNDPNTVGLEASATFQKLMDDTIPHEFRLINA